MGIRLSKTEQKRLGIPARTPGKSKYRAVRTVVDGITFASKKEATRYGVLKAMEQAGEIAALELQPRFDLHVFGGKKVGFWKGDFRYLHRRSGRIVVEDCKGFRTPIYALKKRMVEAEYGFKILET